eukprot:jgi/Galph1/3516/GphlegSOOS_G2159.1
MLVYKDAFSGDEVCSDAMKNVREEENGLLLVCDSYNIAKGGEDYGIEINEEEEGGPDNQIEQVNIVVESFGLQPFPISKKDYQATIKRYSKKVKEYLEKNQPERMEKFMEGMKAWLPKMLKEFDEYEFYMSKSCDPEAGLVMSKYQPEAIYPTFYYIKDGLIEEKF